MITKKRMKEFLNKLEGKSGCNFREDAKGHATFSCNASAARPKAHKILRSMGVADSTIKQIMKIAESNGGYCDCEILFNAGRALIKEAE
jgi:hypothetical protein